MDDSPTYLHILSEALRGEGYDVVLARSGEEALDLLAVQSVDCILLDLIMPGLGGRDTCQRIKSAPGMRDIPLILLTAVQEREAMLDGLGAGADDYIAKTAAPATPPAISVAATIWPPVRPRLRALSARGGP